MDDKLAQPKWIKKYLKIAKALADDNQACYSRKIGVVLISEHNAPISFGYNGSVENAPHTDAPEYLKHLFENLLSDDDKSFLKVDNCEQFVETYSGCQTCPRKLLNIPSGERLELCNCAHAERNALALANKTGTSTYNSTIFCACGIPCHECTIQIIQAGVKRVVCLKTGYPDYSPSSRGLFKMSGIELIIVDPAEYINV